MYSLGVSGAETDPKALKSIEKITYFHSPSTLILPRQCSTHTDDRIESVYGASFNSNKAQHVEIVFSIILFEN